MCAQQQSSILVYQNKVDFESPYPAEIRVIYPTIFGNDTTYAGYNGSGSMTMSFDFSTERTPDGIKTLDIQMVHNGAGIRDVAVVINNDDKWETISNINTSMDRQSFVADLGKNYKGKLRLVIQ